MIDIRIIIANANFIQFDLWALYNKARLTELEYKMAETRLQTIRDEARKCECHEKVKL